MKKQFAKKILNNNGSSIEPSGSPKIISKVVKVLSG